jgi:hypothetical protein
MAMDVLLSVVLVSFSQANGHEQANPLYKELLIAGVSVGGGNKSPLPAPSMPDGLDAQAQNAILKKIAGEDYDLGEMLRKSVYAPQVIRQRNITPSDPKAPARGVDVWFVAHGDLKTLSSKEYLERLLSANKKDGKAHELTAVELAQRGITLQTDGEKHEGYGHIDFPLLERVEIGATGRMYWSRTNDSIVVAGVLDRRFLSDPLFPNQWRRMTRNDDGKFEYGPPEPYDNAGYYVKLTRLVEPKGALLVESHLIFTEPVQWFNAANLLRSKLPPVIQSQVRSARQEILKTTK